MGNLHLITGHAGTSHVTASDQASLNAAIFGEKEYVLNRGSKLKSTIISNNQIRIADGDLLMQGRHIRLNEGSYVDLAVENGQQGTVRNDLVVARYTKNGTTGIEDCNLVIIKGTASASTATDPGYTVGSIIHDNVLLADMPLYRIRVVNLNIEELVPLFEVLPTLSGAEWTKKLTVQLTSSGWTDKMQTVSVDGVTASNIVFVSPEPASYADYAEAGIRCTEQAEGKLTFTCDNVPDGSVTVNVVLL